MSSPPIPDEQTASGALVLRFLRGPVPVLLMIASLLAGFISLQLTAREEEPQIVVPLADVLVRAPGLDARQVERLVATRLEKLLFQIDGVEYVYSSSSAGQCVVTVRFYVGEDREDSIVRIYNKLHSNLDLIPRSVTSWVVKPIEIDDVPIVIATLWSRDPGRVGHFELRRLAEEAEIRLQAVKNTNRVSIVGGWPRELRVEVDPEALAARRTTPMDVAFALGISNREAAVGQVDRANEAILLEAGRWIGDANELRDLVVNVVDGLPVSLRDVARVIDGPAEAEDYTWIGFGPADLVGADAAGGAHRYSTTAQFWPAVHLAIAKQKGSNAVWVADAVIDEIEHLDATLFPEEVEVRITRNYGETADEKVGELVEGLGVAVITVVLFIGLVLGWREAAIIALAIPVCYGATLAVNYLAGYTINRVTLFALILALGLLVDDPITDVENIARYFHRGRLGRRRAVLRAVMEVRPALIMSTIAIILSFVPLFFITGLMGPYMRPMALNVPLTVTMSTVVAIVITPFLAFRLLKYRDAREAGEDEDDSIAEAAHLERSPVYRFYRSLIGPLLAKRWRGALFLGVIGLMFVASLLLPAFRLVPLKMLPYDNKAEFQIVINMNEGTPVEQTDATARALADYLLTVPEVRDVSLYSGIASPMDFNGMIRHYYLRGAPHDGELRVNLLHKGERVEQSHELVLRHRTALESIASAHGAAIQIVEVPPGPPVIATVTAEIYGDDTTPYSMLEEGALRVAERLRAEELLADIDTTVEAPQRRFIFATDKEKASLSGVATGDLADTLQLAFSGFTAGIAADLDESQPLPIVVKLARRLRADPGVLETLQVRGRAGIVKERDGGAVRDAPQPLVALGELGQWVEETRVSTIYHKNLRRVAYVFGEVAGRPPGEAILDVMADQRTAGTVITDAERATTAYVPLDDRSYIHRGAGLPWALPPGTQAVWTGEGEWKITLDAFRDLGIAFAVANVGIFFVLWLQTGSVTITLILMTAIPLTLIGVMPGFWLLNTIGLTSIAGFPNPTFFTATAMIGMIALSGIVVRNSLVLVDFIHQALRDGLDLREAIVRSGAIRLRPIILTAGTTFLGNIIITLDPIFSGLAWAIIFGIFASTLFSLGVVPVIYYLVFANTPGHGLPVLPAVDEEEEGARASATAAAETTDGEATPAGGHRG
jgi:multidrug efflux pump subunit AcrB